MNWKHIAVGIVVLAAVVAGAATAASFFGTTDGEVHWETPDGPAITTVDVDVEDSVPIRDGVVDFGHTSFASDERTHAQLDEWGETTVVSGIEADNELTIESQYQEIRVEGIDGVEFEQIDLDSTSPEFVFDGQGEARVGGIEDDFVRVEREDSHSIAAVDDGFAAFEVDNEEISIVSLTEPELFNPSPFDERIDDSDISLEFEIAYDDFGEDDRGEQMQLDVDWYLNGEFVDDGVITEDGVVSQAVDEDDGVERGDNEWEAVVEDMNGNEYQIEGSFGTPEELFIRDETEPDELIDDADIEITFFGDDGETVVEREAEDGIVDMSGLPIDKSYSVEASADGFLTRQTFARSVIDQQDVFMLPEDEEFVETQFAIDDPRGEFRSANTRIFVKRALTIDDDTSYRTVVGDDVGSGFSTTLNRDVRYLVEVENIETGEIRQMGPYTATSDGEVTLEVSEFEYDFSIDTDRQYDWGAEYLNDTQAIDVVFDANQTIDRLDIEVESLQGNFTYNESTRNIDGTYQTRVPLDDVEKPWLENYEVSYEIVIDGEEYSGGDVVGEGNFQQDLPIPDSILHAISVGIVILMAGLFSQANVGIGAIVTSLTAGGFWFIGIMPPSVSGMSIAIGLMIGVMVQVRQGQQTTPR